MISGLRRPDGTVCANAEEDQVEIMNFYQNLYASQGPSNASELLSYVPERVTPATNGALNKTFELGEVRTALFQMSPSKAPGVDGFTAGFFQKHWKLLREDVTFAVLNFLNGGELPLGLNDTSIMLIPKVRNLQSISQYRPISLCPVLYKLAVKVITNRLREFMDEIVSEEQSAFIPR